MAGIKFSRGVNKWKPSQSSSGYYKLYSWGYSAIHFERLKSAVSKTGYYYKVKLNKRGTGGSRLLGTFETKTAALKYAKSYMRSH